jgi:hypothetical protein
MNLQHSRYNAALFEYVAPGEAKPFKFKREAAPPITGDTLHPGESLTLHYDHAPAEAVGRTNLNEWRGVKDAALAAVELHLRTEGRPVAAGKVTVESSAPIVSVVNRSTGEQLGIARDEAIFRVEVPVRGASMSCACKAQRSRISLPPFDGALMS